MNPFNVANGLLADLETAIKKADKDVIKTQLATVAEDIKSFDTSGLDEFGRHFVSDVATRLAAALDAK